MKRHNLLLLVLFSLATIISCNVLDNPKPIADFTFTGGGFAPCQVFFENNSKDASRYLWDFGDGTNSNETNPEKTYDSGGTFSVTLTAQGKGGTNSVSKQVVIDPPHPLVEISPVSISISLPNNCPTSFQISNVGAEGSILDYVVADDGALQGYLDIKNATGSLSSGNSATIIVTVKKDFVETGFGSIEGSTFVLRIYTPQASNFLVIPVSVNIKSVIGTWIGTWSGKSYSSGMPYVDQLTSPVNGTWILDLQTTNATGKTASGTLTWNGVDKYWIYTWDNNGDLIATPNPFIPDRTIQFNSSNATLVFPSAGSCNMVQLTIDGTKDKLNSSDGYGPWFNVFLDTQSNTAGMTGDNGFVTKPYDPGYVATEYSNGNLTGSKQ